MTKILLITTIILLCAAIYQAKLRNDRLREDIDLLKQQIDSLELSRDHQLSEAADYITEYCS